MDLGVVADDGAVLILGEAKKTRRELDLLLKEMERHIAADPGRPVGANGMAKAAWKLTHQLWVTRSPWLWLVGPNDRRAFTVSYRPTLKLTLRPGLPTPAALGLGDGPDQHPLLRLAGTPSRL